MAACISSRPRHTAETLAFDRSWADIKPSGTCVHAADVATRPHQPYPSSSSASSSTLSESIEPGRLNDRTSWFSAKTAVWDPRVLLNAVRVQGPDESLLHKAVEWGMKCHSDLSDEEQVDNVLLFLAHAIGLRTTIDTNTNYSSQSSHSRSDSAWSSLSEASLSTSPCSDTESLVDFRCETPMNSSRPSVSPSPSIRSYCMAEPDEEPGSIQSSVVFPEIPSLGSSMCYSEASEKDRAMDELRDIVRRAIIEAEEDSCGPLGFAEIHAAARDMSYARYSSTPSVKIQTTSPRKTTPSPAAHPLTMGLADSVILTPLVRATPAPGLSPPVSEHPLPAPPTPRSKPGKLHKPRPVLASDPIPLQTFNAGPEVPSTPSPRSQTPRAPESPAWSHSLLKPFGLRLDVHMLTDAISGLGIRKPISPTTRDSSPPATTASPSCSPKLKIPSHMDLPNIPSPVDSPIEPQWPSAIMKRHGSAGGEWQYLRKQSGDTDDTPVLATPIDEWYVPQFTPAKECAEWEAGVGSK
ncbi:hypothetical protein RhiJN_23839 [Ceratobasidium sp. AG-Ba]|nr:hypothetical protein RhiJN_23839 [Ceratobasidium sp. AG-Ba]